MGSAVILKVLSLAEGVSNGSFKFSSARKIWLCSICLQNLDGCLLARARKRFAIVLMLGFSMARNSKVVL